MKKVKTTKIPEKKSKNITHCTGYIIQYDKFGKAIGAKLTSSGKEELYLDAPILAALEMDLEYQEDEDFSLR